jgi:hypothetical protein
VLLLSACSRDQEAQGGREVRSQEPPIFRSCNNSIAIGDNRFVTNFRAVQDRQGQIFRLRFYVKDPRLAPAINGNPGTLYIAVNVGEAGVSEVRNNRRDPGDLTSYPRMNDQAKLAWALVVFGNHAITYDSTKDFAVTPDDDFPTRELVFLEGEWAVRTIVPDDKASLAPEFGKQARAGLSALLAVRQGCKPAMPTQRRASTISWRQTGDRDS